MIMELKFERFLNILVAEDNINNQIYMKALLRNMGCDFTIANNGQEAMDELVGNRYDVILMDLNMPVLDGIGATKKIRETDKIIPIIAVTACVEDHFRRETKEVGMNDFIGKPFNRKILYSTINKHVS